MQHQAWHAVNAQGSFAQVYDQPEEVERWQTPLSGSQVWEHGDGGWDVAPKLLLSTSERRLELDLLDVNPGSPASWLWDLGQGLALRPQFPHLEIGDDVNGYVIELNALLGKGLNCPVLSGSQSYPRV